MSTIENAIKEIVRIREEISLKVHLLELDAEQEWQVLCEKVRRLEQEFEHDLLTLAQKIGHAEEEFFVGDEQEIEALLTQFSDLQAKVS